METLAKLWPLWAALGVMNLITFIVYAVDKRIAQKNRGGRRVPERTLLLLAFCGGCIGALLGMYLLRHKTKHAKFVVLVPVAVLLWVAAFVALVLFCCGVI
ncbi:MAG: DUF1294 domain-containing protein [Clostridia bacterium]|jgi:uncharacterized membrane protein YsdA (DUF1294 family)|nr:DUF1294 domain-containing protein [Clostridia bacterium]MBR0435752.1 DUF1294 domain-containing protein [Clostridia bacterium]MBR2644886.1 DUF1294 domain-containing protein [Clostridia bacterium]MBR3037195.1 DUF1294 domain-containing protein [Clostridia bacterium]MBR3129246.1 DUF1294 domain-containing protein [Clostridia bacterium]